MDRRGASPRGLCSSSSFSTALEATWEKGMRLWNMASDGPEFKSWLNLNFCLIWSYLTSLMEKAMATPSSVLAWRIPRTVESGALLSTGLHRVGHDWSDLAATSLSFRVLIHKILGKIISHGLTRINIRSKVQGICKVDTWQEAAVCRLAPSPPEHSSWGLETAQISHSGNITVPEWLQVQRGAQSLLCVDH